MTQIIFVNYNGVVSLGPVSKEEDLRPNTYFQVNGCHSGGRCYVCGKHMSELKPFGGPGDPLVGDFNGELLVKRWRRDGPYDEEAEKAMKQAEEEVPDFQNQLDWFIAKFGQEKGEQLALSAQCYHGASSSWECRDCIVLDDDDYFKIIAEQFRAEREKENTRNP